MISILLLLFSFTAGASQCWLTSELTQDGHLYVDCRTGKSPYKRLCRVNKNKQAAKLGHVYDVVIVNPVDDSFLGTIEEWIGLNSRPWSPSETLAEGERIVCSLNQDRLNAFKVKRQSAREAVRKARLAETDRLDKLDRAKRQFCRKQNKDNLEKILCAEWRREKVDDQ